MSERDELARLLAYFFAANRQPHMSGDPRNRLSPMRLRELEDAVDAILAAGYRRIPKPGTEEWEAMVERALRAYWDTGEHELGMDAALRAALQQPDHEPGEGRGPVATTRSTAT
jgi:hypothetical protein